MNWKSKFFILCSILIVTSNFIGCYSNDNKHPNTDSVLFVKAEKLYAGGNYEEAIQQYSELIERNPQNGKLYFSRGKAFAKTLAVKSAQKDFLKSAELRYRISSSYFNIGVINSYINDSTALEYFQKCLMCEPSHVKAKEKIEQCIERLGINSHKKKT